VTTVYLSLGSNLGDREGYLRNALQLLRAAGLDLKRVSGIYETEPRDLTGQPLFLNLVSELETDRPPRDLLRIAQQVEEKLGRERIIEKGPRTIDIDILFHGDLILETVRLTIPHPRLAQRRFVLEPLAELAPGYVHPVLGKTIRELAAGVAGQAVRLYSRSLTEGAGS